MYVYRGRIMDGTLLRKSAKYPRHHFSRHFLQAAPIYQLSSKWKWTRSLSLSLSLV